MPRVFLTQEPLRKDRITERLTPIFDLAPARRFGKLVPVAPWAFQVGETDSRELLRVVEEGLDGYEDGDYVLPVGHPALIGVTIAVAARLGGGRVRLLVWSREAGSYRVFDVDLFPVHDGVYTGGNVV